MRIKSGIWRVFGAISRASRPVTRVSRGLHGQDLCMRRSHVCSGLRARGMSGRWACVLCDAEIIRPFICASQFIVDGLHAILSGRTGTCCISPCAFSGRRCGRPTARLRCARLASQSRPCRAVGSKNLGLPRSHVSGPAVKVGVLGIALVKPDAYLQLVSIVKIAPGMDALVDSQCRASAVLCLAMGVGEKSII